MPEKGLDHQQSSSKALEMVLDFSGPLDVNIKRAREDLSYIGITDPDEVINSSLRRTQKTREKKRVDQEQLKKEASQNLALDIFHIQILETKVPGGFRLLHETYGLPNASVVHLDQLEREARLHGKETRYGVTMTSTHDHNEALSHPVNATFLLDMESSHYGYLNRHAWMRNNLDFAKKMISLKNMYGGKNKMSFLIVEAHGSQNGVSISESDQIVSDIIESGSARWQDFFVDHPTIVLASCSTGMPGGIAEKLSKKLNATVFAPSQDTYSEQIRMSDKGVTAIFHEGLTNIYSNGHLVEQKSPLNAG